MVHGRLAITIIALSIFATGCTSMSGSSGRADPSGKPVDVLVRFHPMAYLASFDLDGFEVEDSNESEEIQGFGSFMPNLVAGVGINAGETAQLQVTAGPGWLWNFVFNTPFLRLDGAARFKLGEKKKISLGPHASLLFFAEPNWTGDTDIELDSTTGVLVGGDMAIQFNERFGMTVSLDYLSAAFDVQDDWGVWTSDDELDLTGLVIQAGVFLTF